MPTYHDFKCNACGLVAAQAITDQAEDDESCPKCDSTDCEYRMKF